MADDNNIRVDYESFNYYWDQFYRYYAHFYKLLAYYFALCLRHWHGGRVNSSYNSIYSVSRCLFRVRLAKKFPDDLPL
ncbi:hypothetical protein ANCCAN_29920 [Ancylostoma caninum]|uniref:Uncharacterized protein n=1 Tax=Ancylostoma caninum TaxID=29170 RepID=A0A368EX98_ANCCA|nr:hypothetical protein ANCCAN_29920 [Ancylostoma caninum]